MQRQEALLIFQKGEYKSIPEPELLVWPQYHASFPNHLRHSTAEDTETKRRQKKPRERFASLCCGSLENNSLAETVPLCQGAKGSLIPVPSWQMWHKPIGGPHTSAGAAGRHRAKPSITFAPVKQTNPHTLPLTGHSVLKKVRS